MKRMVAAFAAFAVGMVLCSSTGFAAGFRLPEQDTAALGMASAFVGQADDPAAVRYNPAGMTQLDGTQVSAGVVGIYPVLTHENNTVNPGTTDVSQRDIHLPFHVYATHKMNDRIAFGIGVTNPFGLVTDWDPTSSTRYVATFSKVVTAEVNPNVAYKLSDNLSAAFGIAYVHLRATLENAVNLGVGINDNFRLSGDGDGWGANVALMYKAAPNVSDIFIFGVDMAKLSGHVKPSLIDLEDSAELTGRKQANAVQRERVSERASFNGFRFDTLNRMMRQSELPHNVCLN